MKKFTKFILGSLSLAAIAGGAFYFLKNVVNKESNDDFDDFDDDFDDFNKDDDVDTESSESDILDDTDSASSRGYVTINISDTPEDELKDGDENSASQTQTNVEPDASNE